MNHLVEFDTEVMGLELRLVVDPFGIEFPARAEVPLQMADTAGTAVQLLVLVKGERDLCRPDGGNVKLQNHPPLQRKWARRLRPGSLLISQLSKTEVQPDRTQPCRVGCTQAA